VCNELLSGLPHACLTAATPLSALPVTNVTSEGEPATGTLLDSVVAAPGSTLSVASFSVPGSDAPIQPGTSATVTDPATGAVTGTIVVNPDLTYVFTPAPGFTGPVPTVTATVLSSDGQSVNVPLTITVHQLLLDANENRSTPVNTPVTTNVLANVDAPPGTTVSVTSFTLPGTGVVYPSGPNPVPVVDPITKATVGSIVVLPNGTATFTPTNGFSGQAPTITYTVTCSDGQISPGALTITVLPGELALATPMHPTCLMKVHEPAFAR
jgi:hypothetical protein